MGARPSHVQAVVAGALLLAGAPALADPSARVVEDPGVRSAEAALAVGGTSVTLPHSLGVREGATWAVIEGLDAGPELVLDLRQSAFDVARLHERLPDGTWRVQTTGLRVPWSVRPVPHWNAAFDLDQSATAHVLEVESVLPMTLSPRVLREAELAAQIDREQTSMAVFLGAVFMMAAYNFFLYASLRDRSYLYYVVTTLLLHGGVSWFACGMHFSVMPAEQTELARTLVRAVIGLSMIAVAAFGSTYLDTARHHPRWHRAYQGYAALGMVSSLSSFLLPDATLPTWTIFAGMPTLPIILLGSGLSAYRAGNTAARFFVLAWVVYSVAMMVMTAAEAGALANSEMIRQFLRAGSVAEVLLLSFALADRISVLQAQRLTDQQEALLAERRARAAEDRASQAQREFLAVMSHELRTPLNGVIGSAEVLEGTRLDEEQGELVRTISASAESLLGTLQDILDYTSAMSARGEAATPFALSATLDGAIAASRAQAARKGLQWDQRFDDLPAMVVGPQACVRRVVAELVENAVKFTASGVVQLNARVEGAGVVVEVRDTGPGIPAERAKDLFEPFAVGVTHSARTAGGTGMGLALARKLCEAVGAEIALDSAPGQGTLVRLMVPVAPAT